LLAAVIREAAGLVTQPGDTVTVLAAWAAASAAGSSGEAGPPVGELGGGSDHLPFTSHLGVPGLSFGFGGPAGIYHSAYDTFGWMSRYGDPGFAAHRAAARLAGLTLARLANPPVLPLDYAAFGRRYADAARAVTKRAAERGTPLRAGTELAAAFEALAEAGERFAARRALAGVPDSGSAGRANRLLRSAGAEFVRAEGLPGRPWVRHLLVTADRDRGYANVVLPGVAEAIEDGDLDRAEAEAADLAARSRRAAGVVDAATAVLGG
jgi:N-acetylated-alpha-linked acidic dipeptidase